MTAMSFRGPTGVRSMRWTLPVVTSSLLLYFVLLGGTPLGEVSMPLRAANAAIGAPFIVWYVVRIRTADRIDKTLLLALLVFLLACVLSSYRRESFDAAVSGLALAAGAFTARRAFDAIAVRRAFMWSLVVLSVFLSTVLVALWLGPIWSWWTAVGFQVTPPLGMELSGYMWGHRHDATLLLLMVYPGWWLESPSPARRMAGIAFAIVALPIVLVDGSRTMWIAVAVATVVALFTTVRHYWTNLRTARPAVAWSIAGAVLLTATVLGLAVLDRATNLESLRWRAELWHALVTAWTDRPVSGFGPGSFAWILQQTSYFDTNSWAPRHPDNAIFHMWAEGGLLGLGALALVGTCLGIVAVRTKSRAARWALVLFSLACLGGNPTNFMFILAVVLCWGAYASPATSPTAERTSRGVTMTAVACLLILTVTFVAISAAHRAYDEASTAAIESGAGDAVPLLDKAVRLDPGLALYWRERGIARYLSGDSHGAEGDLERAAEINASDDVIWRSLAVVRTTLGDAESAELAIATALAVQRSDPANLLLAAALTPGGDRRRSEILSEALRAWPQLAFADGWRDLLADGTSPDDVASSAFDAWLKGTPTPELHRDQGIWLSAFVGRPDEWTGSSGADAWGTDLSQALADAIRCETSVAAIEALPRETRRSSLYWLLHYRAGVMEGEPLESDLARYAMIAGQAIRPANVNEHINPLNENDPLSADIWGYRRSTIHWQPNSIALPSVDAGFTSWVTRPIASAEDSGLSKLADACRGN